jgi:hypothetical protein
MSKNRIIPVSEYGQDMRKLIKDHNLDGIWAEALAKSKETKRQRRASIDERKVDAT